MRRALIALLALAAAVPARAATNDPFFDQQWGIAKLGAEAAWAVSRGQGTLVAVIDTGVDPNHPDLKGRIAPGGIDYVDGDDDPRDENGHGTHMAGTIAAVTGNGVGIASVAPDARILPIRVLDRRGQTDDPVAVADAIRYAADNGAHVINLSLAAEGPNTPGGGNADQLFANGTIDVAIRYADSAGVVVVIASGNTESGGKTRTSYDATVGGAIVVGAATSGDRRAAYSNYGSGLDVLAPGGGSPTDPNFSTGCTSSNAVVGLFWDEDAKRSEYAGACGTSVGVAHVSGIAALLRARGFSNDAAVARIKATAVDLGPAGWDTQTGHGRVSASRALGASPGASPPKPEPSSSPQPSGGRVGAAASPGPSVSTSASPSPTSTSSSSPSDGSGDRPPSAAPPGDEDSNDRGTPLAVAGVLVFFMGWAHVLVRRWQRPA